MTTPAGLSWNDAIAAVHSPGQMFELVDAEVRGVKMAVFKHAPANLTQIFGLARGHGDKDFLVYEGERWSFAKTFEQVDALAHRLVNVYGINKGDRVAIAMRNYPEWAMAFAGIVIAGGVSVSMNSWWTEDETDYALRDSGAKVLICDDQRFENARKTCAELGIHVLLVRSELPSSAGHDRWETALELGAAAPAVEIVPDDDATILYTSGTTGRPKGAVSTHRAVISALMAFSARQAIEGVRATEKPEPDPFPPSFILIVPLFHVTGCVA
ncbi:MAG: AMP-binding protein, partial [Actinomycetota bacterium]|nr:AMP-binding protein [Actinomycetota bacterium]